MPPNQDDDDPILTLSSREVYRNRWMRVREDAIVRGDGREGIYGVVEKPAFALVIPHDRGWFYVVEQFRYAVGARTLEFPQGSWEADPTVSPEQLAAAELREETGLRAESLRYLGPVLTAPGYSNQVMHVFVAEQLSAGAQELSPEERGLRCQRIEVTRFQALVRSGEIRDASTLAAYALLQLSGAVELPTS
jgi:ADP-ribose pyrophosphatase